MRDNWNHPSVAIWDAGNESYYPELANTIVPAMRKLDLSNRPWEDSFNPPDAPDDPVEENPYEFIGWQLDPNSTHPFSMTDLESAEGTLSRNGIPTGHAEILNEYGWLWLYRNGDPTPLTTKIYSKLLGPHNTAQQRLEADAYYVAGLTELYRAYRRYAGVLEFHYLFGHEPGAATCDNFRDVRNIELNPYFAD